jgi:hypothetical protein
VPGIQKTFKPGEFLRIMSPAAAYDRESWGEDCFSWKGTRFVEGGDTYYGQQRELFDFVETSLTSSVAFGGGATACPGRFVAVVELSLIAAHLIRNFDFGEHITFHQKLPDEGSDMGIGPELRSPPAKAQIIDADGTVLNVTVTGIENHGSSLWFREPCD